MGPRFGPGWTRIATVPKRLVGHRQEGRDDPPADLCPGPGKNRCARDGSMVRSEAATPRRSCSGFTPRRHTISGRAQSRHRRGTIAKSTDVAGRLLRSTKPRRRPWAAEFRDRRRRPFRPISRPAIGGPPCAEEDVRRTERRNRYAVLYRIERRSVRDSLSSDRAIT